MRKDIQDFANKIYEMVVEGMEKADKKKIRKVPTEIYSRVVGYFRPVNQWHPGKQQEFEDRKAYKVDESRL